MATARRFATPRSWRWGAALLASGAVPLALVAAPALSGSSAVSGRLVSERVTGSACASPVGVCARGTLKGDLKGTFEFKATSLTATADTPATGVVVYTADLVVTTGDGTLICKDPGALATGQERSMAGVWTVIGGEGRFAGASGHLRIAGTRPGFEGPAADPRGEAEYEVRTAGCPTRRSPPKGGDASWRRRSATGPTSTSSSRPTTDADLAALDRLLAKLSGGGGDFRWRS